MKKILLAGLVVVLSMFVGVSSVSAHTAVSTCGSITLANAPAGSTATLTPGNMVVPGNGTFSIAAGTYTITWSDGYVASNVVVASCPNPPPSTNFHFFKMECPSWSVLKGNQSAHSLDDTLGHYTEFNNYPSFPLYTPKPITQSEVPAACSPLSGWSFKLSTDQSQVQNVSIVGTTNANGEFTIPLSGLNSAQRDALNLGNSLWISEVTQSPYGFGAIRCYNDALNGDNLEFIRFSGTPPSDVYCVAYNITPPTTINVVKTIINDSGGTKTISDFPLFVNGGPVVSGVTNTFPPGAYTVTETTDANYVRTFSGDCDTNGDIDLDEGDTKFCVITNNDIGAPVIPAIPPLIDIVKVPSPLALPGGPGPVTYTYTLRNIGTVPVTNVTMVGDTCSPIVLISGDTDTDSQLDLNETWIYRCTITLSATHTNTVTATGWANGLSAVDVASATVIVGAPPVPPLIDVVKVPSPLALPNGPGQVDYTYTLRNIGTVPVTNITMIDDTCGTVALIVGDVNHDSILDVNETWIYTCAVILSQTTTNTVVTTGLANGLSAVDIAIATVVVGAPIVPPIIHVTKIPSPLALLAGGGMVTYTEIITNHGAVALSNVTLTDDTCAPMVYVSGDTDLDSQLDLNEAWTYTCQKNVTQTTTNTATATGTANGVTATDVAIVNVIVGAPVNPPIPPLIDVVKIPSPLSISGSSGQVTYGYTLRNIGTVPVTNITMIDDTCSPLTLISGDSDTDSQLDLNETWVYRCSMTLSQTTTNTVVTTGWANGLSAVDIAIATVVVGGGGGSSSTPPLIHVVKVPNPQLLPVGGGTVTYTETITNPGTVSVNNITLTDNTCSPMVYVSGDTDLDSRLDPDESWVYTCQRNVTQTTTNTATATGDRNGVTATDIAVATVVVAAPAFPNTGGGGAPVVPPLIHVTTVPNPLTLSFGGTVTYTQTVTNIGTVALRDITLTYDVCSSMTYISGDSDGDVMIDVNEAWIYTCQKYISEDTTNAVTATGDANGFRATDLAIATVLVSRVPGFPNTGFSAEEKTSIWDMIIFYWQQY